MMKLIEGLSPDALGIEVSGKLTHEDYQNVLLPVAEAKMRPGPIKMLFVAGPDFTGYELEAMWDDAAFGFKHWRHFKRVAVVTESPWLRAAITMFSPFFASQVRLFRLGEIEAAKAWLSAEVTQDH